MAPINKVKDLAFSDLYLGHPTLSDRFSDVPGGHSNPMPADASLGDDLQQLREVCQDAFRVAPITAELKVRHDGATYRVAALPSQGGTVFVLRKLVGRVQSLSELGIPQAYMRCLLRAELSGLLVVSGGIGAGKTMTACALVKDRLTVHGGVAVTRENPIELSLEGIHGQGMCFQTDARPDRVDAGLPQAYLRWGARIVLVDEIRDCDTAVELMRASVNGQLIVTTILADGVVPTIAKLHAMVQDRMDAANARTLLVEGLAGVLHMRRTRTPKPKLETEFLFLKDAPQARASLRSGNYDLLQSDVQRQMASMIADSAAALRKAY
jgi:type II secretory ATPase GspE/PulE/Tfp pilus assembly ATPase PilB-like protein